MVVQVFGESREAVLSIPWLPICCRMVWIAGAWVQMLGVLEGGGWGCKGDLLCSLGA